MKSMAKQTFHTYVQWPRTLQIVDAPTIFPAYKPNIATVQPSLIDAEILIKCDPRLSNLLPESSIYRRKSEPLPSNFASSLSDCFTHESRQKISYGSVSATVDVQQDVERQTDDVLNELIQTNTNNLAVSIKSDEGERGCVEVEQSIKNKPEIILARCNYLRLLSSEERCDITAGRHQPVEQNTLGLNDGSLRETDFMTGRKRKLSDDELNECHSVEKARRRRTPIQQVAVKKTAEVKETRTVRKTKLHSKISECGSFSVSHLRNLTKFVDFVPNIDDPLLHITFCEVEDLCANQRQDFLSDLNSVFLGRRPRFLASERDRIRKHFASLSSNTQFSGYFISSDVVNHVLMDVISAWMKEKPLDKVLCALRNNSGYVMCDDQPLPVIDHMNEAFRSWLSKQLTDIYVMSSDDVRLCYDIFIGSSVPCYNVTNRAFRQVKQDLEIFLASFHSSYDRLKASSSDSLRRFSEILTQRRNKKEDEPTTSLNPGRKLTVKSKKRQKDDTDCLVKSPSKICTREIRTNYKERSESVRVCSKDVLTDKPGGQCVESQMQFVKSVEPIRSAEAKDGSILRSISEMCLELTENVENDSDGASQHQETLDNLCKSVISKPNRVSIKHLRHKKRRSHRYKSKSKVRRKSSKGLELSQKVCVKTPTVSGIDEIEKFVLSLNQEVKNPSVSDDLLSQTESRTVACKNDSCDVSAEVAILDDQVHVTSSGHDMLSNNVEKLSGLHNLNGNSDEIFISTESAVDASQELPETDNCTNDSRHPDGTIVVCNVISGANVGVCEVVKDLMVVDVVESTSSIDSGGIPIDVDDELCQVKSQELSVHDGTVKSFSDVYLIQKNSPVSNAAAGVEKFEISESSVVSVAQSSVVQEVITSDIENDQSLESLSGCDETICKLEKNSASTAEEYVVKVNETVREASETVSELNSTCMPLRNYNQVDCFCELDLDMQLNSDPWQTDENGELISSRKRQYESASDGSESLVSINSRQEMSNDLRSLTDDEVNKLKVMEQLKHMAVDNDENAFTAETNSSNQSCDDMDAGDVFIPQYNLYQDSFQSLLVDPYSVVPHVNFEPYFDPTRAPICHSNNPFKLVWPVLNAFVNEDLETLKSFGSVPDVSSFNVSSVNRKTSFLWALVLSVFRHLMSSNIPTKTSSAETVVHQTDNVSVGATAAATGSLKGNSGRIVKSSNPLIQAFRQAVEAKRKVAMKPKLPGTKLLSDAVSKGSKPTLLPGRIPIVFNDALKTGGSLSAIVSSSQPVEENRCKIFDIISLAVDSFLDEIGSQFGLLSADQNESNVLELLKEGNILDVQHLRPLSDVSVQLYEHFESTKSLANNEYPILCDGSSDAESQNFAVSIDLVPLDITVNQDSVYTDSSDLVDSPGLAVLKRLKATKDSSVGNREVIDDEPVVFCESLIDTVPSLHVDLSVITVPTLMSNVAKTKPEMLESCDARETAVKSSSEAIISSDHTCSAAENLATESIVATVADMLPPPLPPLSLSDFLSVSIDKKVCEQSKSSSMLTAPSSTGIIVAEPVMSASQVVWSLSNNSCLFTYPLDQLVQFPPPSVPCPPRPCFQSAVPPPSVPSPSVHVHAASVAGLCVPPVALPPLSFPPPLPPPSVPLPSFPPPTVPPPSIPVPLIPPPSVPRSSMPPLSAPSVSISSVNIPPPSNMPLPVQFPPPLIPPSVRYFSPSAVSVLPLPPVADVSVPPPNFLETSASPAAGQSEWMHKVVDDQNTTELFIGTLHSRGELSKSVIATVASVSSASILTQQLESTAVVGAVSFWGPTVSACRVASPETPAMPHFVDKTVPFPDSQYPVAKTMARTEVLSHLNSSGLTSVITTEQRTEQCVMERSSVYVAPTLSAIAGTFESESVRSVFSVGPSVTDGKLLSSGLLSASAGQSELLWKTSSALPTVRTRPPSELKPNYPASSVFPVCSAGGHAFTVIDQCAPHQGTSCSSSSALPRWPGVNMTQHTSSSVELTTESLVMSHHVSESLNVIRMSLSPAVPSEQKARQGISETTCPTSLAPVTAFSSSTVSASMTSTAMSAIRPSSIASVSRQVWKPSSVFIRPPASVHTVNSSAANQALSMVRGHSFDLAAGEHCALGTSMPRLDFRGPGSAYTGRPPPYGISRNQLRHCFDSSSSQSTASHSDSKAVQQANVPRLQGRQIVVGFSVPQPVLAPQSTRAHCKPSPNFTVMTPNCNSRIYIFNPHNLPVCKEVQQFLVSKGGRLFDTFNIAALCCIEKMECRVLIHSGSLNAVHRLPNLLRLKRHLVVTFIAYDRFADVLSNEVSVIFPRAGLLVFETTMLLTCQSAVLDTVCRFVQLQTATKGSTWRIFMANDVFAKLETLREKCDDNVLDDVRLTEVTQILENYEAQGFIEFLPAELCEGQPKYMLEYWTSCVSLQAKFCYQYRHFLFITDLPRTHLDAKPFLESGIDVMNIAEFLRGFMAKSVDYQPQESILISSDTTTRLTPSKYVDARLSQSNDVLSV